MIGGLPGSAQSLRLSPHHRPCDRVVARDQARQVDAQQLAIPDADAAVDDAEVDAGWLAEDEGGERIVDGAAGEAEFVEAEADQVGGHAGGEDADVVAAEDRGTAAGGES